MSGTCVDMFGPVLYLCRTCLKISWACLDISWHVLNISEHVWNMSWHVWNMTGACHLLIYRNIETLPGTYLHLNTKMSVKCLYMSNICTYWQVSGISGTGLDMSIVCLKYTWTYFNMSEIRLDITWIYMDMSALYLNMVLHI